MDNVSIIGIDISKRSFQLHGATDSGKPALRKKLSRSKVLEFFGLQPPCLVVMEACGGAHYWGREIQQLGHEVKLAELLFARVAELNAQLSVLDKQIRTMVREHEELWRLMTIPGVGPMCAMAVYAFAPTMETFGRGRDFAAWVGLTPREASTAGRQRLGRITRMGQRDVRQLLILGATAVRGRTYDGA